MRVLHVEAGRHRYGGAVQVGLLLDALDRRGVGNLLVCPPEQPVARDRPRDTVAPIRLRGDLDVLMARRLLARIRAFAPDIVHVHSRRGADLYGGIAARLAGVPAVLTRRVESREPKWLIRAKLGRYARVAAISRIAADELAAAGIERRRLALIPSAVDTSRWRPDPAASGRLRDAFAIPREAPVAVAVAQLIPRKGHRTLLDALARMPARHAALRLVCFGRGPEQAALSARAAAVGLDRRVVFAGYRDDLPALLPGADVLVHPARREGLGAALLEAMSAGVPVVATAAGGITDVVRPDLDGLLVPVGDPAAVAAAIVRLLDDPGLAARLGAAARQRVSAAFPVAAMADAYLDLYRGLCVPGDALLRY